MIQIGSTTISVERNHAGDLVFLTVVDEDDTANAFLPPLHAARVAEALLITAQRILDERRQEGERTNVPV